MQKKNKIILLVSIITIIILGVVGVAYAYSGLFTGNNQQLVLGDIYMHYTETNELVLENAMPSESYDTSKYFEFTINGKNTYQDKDIYYEIVLNHGDDHATRTEKIQDNLLKFTLVEIKDSTETIVVNGVTYDEINSTRIWVNKIEKNTTSEVNITYRLYMWVSSDTTICGGNATGCSYDVETWNEEVYASIKVNVVGDFESKSVGPSTAATDIIAKVGNDGLVAINTDGTLYDGTGEIREYRYSGTTVNNYIFFNDDGDSELEANELWRIVGVFKNDGEWNLKLMRDNALGDVDEIPETYTINGTSYDMVYYGSGPVDYEPTINNLPGSFIANGITRLSSLSSPWLLVWNSTKTGSNYNDWTTAGLQYFLNSDSDDNGTPGYMSSFTNNAKKLIRTTTYYLGNVVYNTDTAITAYDNERNTTSDNIWEGNQGTWTGSVALLYPSDYGYSSSNTYWTTAMWKYSTAQDSVVPADTSWMQITRHTTACDDWLLSATSGGVTLWDFQGQLSVVTAYNYNALVRPTINLISEAKIDIEHEGTLEDPYVIIES